MGGKYPKAQKGLAGSVFDQFGTALRRYLLRRLRTVPHDARDLEQEVYLRLLRVEDAELVRDPQAYMYRIASHVVYEFNQRAREERITFDSDAVDAWADRPSQPLPEGFDEQLSAQRQLERMLSILPPRCCAVFVLHMRDGMTHAEVAQKLGISVHSVKKHVFRAFSALRAEIRSSHWEL